jgi:hypothetical protein
MSEKNTRLNPLELRKRLLLAESELNRAHLSRDVASIMADLRALTDRAQSLGSMASSAAVLVSGLAAFRSPKPAGGKTKLQWWQIALKGAGLVSTLWLASRFQTESKAKINPRISPVG